MNFTAHKMLPVTAFVAFLFFTNFYPACSRNVSFVTKRQAALGDGEGASPRVVSDGQWSRQCSHRVDDVLKAAAKEIARRRGAGGGEAQLSLPNKGGGVGGGHWEEWSVSGRQEAEGGRAKREARGGERDRSGRKSRRRARGRRKKEGSGKEAGWSVLQDVQERIRTEMLKEEGEKRTKHRRIQNIFLETRGRGKDRGGAGKGAVSSGKTRRGGRKGYGGRKRSGREDAAASQRSGNETTAAWGARKRRLPRAVYEWPSGLSLLRPLRSAPGMDMTVQGLSFESFDAATTMGCNFARGEGEAPPALKVAVVFRRAIVTGRVGINGRLHPASDNRAAHGEEEKEKDRGNRRYMECDMSARVSDLTVIVTIHAERRRRLDGGGAGGNMGEWGPEPRGGEDKMEDSKEEEEDGEGWRRDEEEAESREKDEGDDGTPKWRKKVEEGGKGWKGEEATKVGQESKEGVAKGGEWAGVEAKGDDGWKESQDKGNEEWSSQESLAEEGWKEEKPKIGEEWRREEVPPVSKMAPDPVGAFETVASVANGKLEGREADKIGAYHRDEASSVKAPSNRVEPPEEGDEGTRESARVPRVAWGANPRGGQAGVGKRIGGVEAWRGEEDAAGEGLSWMEGGGRGRLGRRDGVAADEVRGVSGTRRVGKWEEGRRLGSGETLAEDAEKWEGIREGGGKTRVGWERSGKGLGWGGEAEEAAASGVSGNSKAKEDHGDEWEPVVGSKAPGWEAERPEASGSEGGKLQGTRSEALREWGEPRGEDNRRERSWVGSKPGGVSRGGHKEARRGGSGPHGNPPSGYMEKWPVLIRGPGVPVEASGRGGGPTGVGAERRQWDEKPKAERRRERWPVFESRPPDKWAVNWVTGEKSQGSNPGRDHHGSHLGQEDHHGPPGARGAGATGPFPEGRRRSQHPGSPMGTHQSPHPPRYPGRSEEGASDHSRGSGFFSNHPTAGKRYRRSTHKSMKYTEPDKNAQIKVWEELKKDPWWSGKHVYLKDAITRDSERKAFINLLTKMTEQERTSEALEGMEAIQIFEIHPHEENITSGGQGGSKKAGLPILAKDDVKSSLAEKDEHPMNVANITWDNIQDSFGHKPGLGFSHLGGGNLTAFNGGVELGRSERRKRSGDQLSGLESLKHARSPILMKSDSFMVGLPLIRFSGCTDDFGWLKQSWESESQFHGHSHVRAPDPLRLKQEMEGLFYGGVKRMIGMFSERTVRGILAEDLATKLGFIVSYG